MNKMTVFGNEASCSMEGRDRRIDQIVRGYIPEDRISNIHRFANLESHFQSMMDVGKVLVMNVEADSFVCYSK
jgi:uncharacterized lipoprotein YajG